MTKSLLLLNNEVKGDLPLLHFPYMCNTNPQWLCPFFKDCPLNIPYNCPSPTKNATFVESLSFKHSIVGTQYSLLLLMLPSKKKHQICLILDGSCSKDLKMLKQILTPLLGKLEKVKIKRLEGVRGGGGRYWGFQYRVSCFSSLRKYDAIEALQLWKTNWEIGFTKENLHISNPKSNSSTI